VKVLTENPPSIERLEIKADIEGLGLKGGTSQGISAAYGHIAVAEYLLMIGVKTYGSHPGWLIQAARALG
jgi:hypothetical protein